MRPYRAALVSLALVAPIAALAAQDSQYAIRSLGTPERQEGVRARTTGGAFALFDALSPLTDAGLAELTRLTAALGAGASYRTVTLGGEDASLQSTRFSSLLVGGPIAPRLTLAGGFSAYLGRSFRVTTRDSVDLRGEPEPYTDDLTSEGGVVDLRLAAAWRVVPRIAIGGGFHVLTGSTRVTVVRRWDDSLTYAHAGEVDHPRFDGLGASGSLLLNPVRGVWLAGYLRSDNRLRYHTRDTTGAYDLPVSWGAGLRWQPGARAAFAAAVQSASWSGAGVNAHDTFSWSAGLEVGRPTMPFRFGVRGGDLAFGPGAAAPTELGFAAGVGFRFSGGRGVIDLGLERLDREGGGLNERVWTVLVGVSVRP